MLSKLIAAWAIGCVRHTLILVDSIITGDSLFGSALFYTLEISHLSYVGIRDGLFIAPKQPPVKSRPRNETIPDKW